MKANTTANDRLVIAGKVFNSRLLLGTGKFSSIDMMKKAIISSGTEIVTLALRRVDLDNPADDLLNSVTGIERIQLLPNTSGARDANEAIRLARLAR
ncbi:MAG TPA: thiazole synthase, partial [Spirochaetota bacterium]|nr:thiazole synthase [Spirochaetota bacterium]